MDSRKKYAIAGWSSLACVSLAIVLFLSLCWAAAADAQGAIAFFLFAPILILLLFGGFYLGRIAAKDNRAGVHGIRLSFIVSIFIIVFYLSPFVGLNSFSNAIIGAVAQSFEWVTGKSPMQWERSRWIISSLLWLWALFFNPEEIDLICKKSKYAESASCTLKFFKRVFPRLRHPKGPPLGQWAKTIGAYFIIYILSRLSGSGHCCSGRWPDTIQSAPLSAYSPIQILKWKSLVLDSATIELCLSLCPWAKFHHDKGATELHTAIDIAGDLPQFAVITDGRTRTSD